MLTVGVAAHIAFPVPEPSAQNRANFTLSWANDSTPTLLNSTTTFWAVSHPGMVTLCDCALLTQFCREATGFGLCWEKGLLHRWANESKWVMLAGRTKVQQHRLCVARSFWGALWHNTVHYQSFTETGFFSGRADILLQIHQNISCFHGLIYAVRYLSLLTELILFSLYFNIKLNVNICVICM